MHCIDSRSNGKNSRQLFWWPHLPGGRAGEAPAGTRLLEVSEARSAVLEAKAAANISPGVCAVMPSRSSLSGKAGWSARWLLLGRMAGPARAACGAAPFDEAARDVGGGVPARPAVDAPLVLR